MSERQEQPSDAPWWSEEYGFFGSLYMLGMLSEDNRENPQSTKKQSIEERTNVEVKGIINLLKPQPGSAILDCACGYGRHSLELASRGFRVTGIDINSEHLEKAQKEAAHKKLSKLKFDKENMLHLPYDCEFDIVINMLCSFGYFDKNEEDVQVLKNFYRALKPEGQCLIHLDANLLQVLAGANEKEETRMLSGGKVLKIKNSYDRASGKVHGSWTLEQKNSPTIQKFYSVRIYAPEVYNQLCKQVGFSECKVYADWDGAVYHRDSSHMIIVAKK